MTRETKRKLITTCGAPRRRDWVRVFRETVRGVSLVRVQWREPAENNRTKTLSWDDTRKGLAEARAFAEGTSERLATSTAAAAFVPISLRDLRDKYVTAQSVHWRPRTLELFYERWGQWELFAGRATLAHLVTRERVDEFVAALVKTKTRHGARSGNQIHRTVDALTATFRWAIDRDLIPPSKVATYRVKLGKDAPAAETSEYQAADRAKLLAAFDPRSALQWRAWAVTTVLAYCGPRINSALYLEWRDVDLEDGAITWRAERDKMGRARVQPMPAPVREAFLVAYGWRTASDPAYTGPFVFFGARPQTRSSGRPWGYQAFNRALHEAEKRAGVKLPKWNAAHAFRRGIAGDVADEFNEKTAAEWIGDEDVRVVRRRYIKARRERVAKVAEHVGTPRTDPEAPDSKSHQNQSGAGEDARRGS